MQEAKLMLIGGPRREGAKLGQGRRRGPLASPGTHASLQVPMCPAEEVGGSGDTPQPGGDRMLQPCLGSARVGPANPVAPRSPNATH